MTNIEVGSELKQLNAEVGLPLLRSGSAFGGVGRLDGAERDESLRGLSRRERRKIELARRREAKKAAKRAAREGK